MAKNLEELKRNVHEMFEDCEEQHNKVVPLLTHTDENYPGCELIEDLGIYIHYGIDLGEAVIHFGKDALEHFKNKLGVDDVHSLAIDNVISNGYVFKSLKNVLEDLGADISLDMPTSAPNMYVLTNPNSRYGAHEILNELALLSTFNEIGPYYILPSSVHEVIILPENEIISPEDLRPIVHDINREVVDKKEWLSDDIFFYDGRRIKRK